MRMLLVGVRRPAPVAASRSVIRSCSKMRGQNVNVPGALAALAVAARPSLARPHIVAADVRKIPFAALRKAGIRAVAFDKDNTLTAPYCDNVHPQFMDAWKACIDMFGQSNIAIVSNSAGGPDDAGYVSARRIEAALGVHVLRHDEKKPAGGSALSAHFGCKPHEIAVVGDRLLTDVVYANRAGALSVLVTDIVTEEGDNKAAVYIRRFERLLLRMLVLSQIQPPTHPSWQQQTTT